MVRDERVYTRVSKDEKKAMKKTCAQLGYKSLSAFIRKMALDGMIINLHLPELNEMIKLLRVCSNNLNQIARKVNATGRVYDSEMEQLLHNQEELWQAANDILAKLAAIK